MSALKLTDKLFYHTISAVILSASGRAQNDSVRECSHYPKRADSEQIFRQTRRISAGILAVFQGNATQYDGKSARIQPLSGSVNTP